MLSRILRNKVLFYLFIIFCMLLFISICFTIKGPTYGYL